MTWTFDKWPKLVLLDDNSLRPSRIAKKIVVAVLMSFSFIFFHICSKVRPVIVQYQNESEYWLWTYSIYQCEKFFLNVKNFCWKVLVFDCSREHLIVKWQYLPTPFKWKTALTIPSTIPTVQWRMALHQNLNDRKMFYLRKTFS